MGESIGKAYKPWIIASVTVLIGSLLLLAIAVIMGFVNFGEAVTPLWVVVLGVLAILGIALGFCGFFLIMMSAGWKSFRESRRVQVISPPHRETDS